MCHPGIIDTYISGNRIHKVKYTEMRDQMYAILQMILFRMWNIS